MDITLNHQLLNLALMGENFTCQLIKNKNSFSQIKKNRTQDFDTGGQHSNIAKEFR